MTQESKKPFAGVRVLDFTHVLAGPFCTYQLAVLGAEVIKIESPADPDMMRLAGPDYDLAAESMGIHFLSQSAGKKAITVDISKPDGVTIIRRLVKTADVLVENFRGGVMERLGLGYAAMAEIKPELIYCSMTGFGHTGPKAEHPAYDNVIQAFSGLMTATGSDETGATKIGPPILDYGTGAQAALAVSAALYHQKQTGLGQHIDVSMLDAALMLMSSFVSETARSGRPPGLPGNSSAYNAGYGVYAASDDAQVMVGAFSPAQFARLWRTLGRDDIAAPVAAMGYEELHEQVIEHRALLASIFKSRPAEHWEQLLNDALVPAARVRTLDEALSSEQVQSRRAVRRLDVSPSGNDTGQNGIPNLTVPVAAFQFSISDVAPESPPPRLSEHTESTLTHAGYSSGEIDSLRQSRIIL